MCDDDCFNPIGVQEEAGRFFPEEMNPWLPDDAVAAGDNTLDDFGEFGLLDPEDEEKDRMWNVYRGVERPKDDADWEACWKHVTESLSLVTGIKFEFEKWQSAWSDSDDSSSAESH